jgi:hypothetical protein
MKRKQPADYIALAKERGFRWIGPKVLSVHKKTTWQCKDGHQWQARFNDIYNGSGCPYCSGKVRKNPADYHKLAKKRGFRWLGPEVPNTRTKTTWQCAKNHDWESRFYNIAQGQGCPYCAGKVRKESEDYKALAKERGFKWIGPEVKSNNKKTTWQCSQGHQWDAPYSSIQQGTGCPHCYGTFPKGPSDYLILAEERGFRWLGPEVTNTKENTTWVCKAGHKWEAPYTTIQSGHGCPECSGLLPKTPDDYHELAKQRKLHWLGPEVQNTKANTAWECSKGHRWHANYHNIQSGTGCPVCLDIVHSQRVSKAQRKLCKMLGGELNHPVDR